MNEIFIPLLLFISIISGYFISKMAHEELKELKTPLRFAFIISASLSLGAAAYINIFYAVAAIIVSGVLLYFSKNDSLMYKMFLAGSGLLIFFVTNIFLYSCLLMLSMIFIVSNNYLKYKKNFLKNVFIYLYFFIPAIIVYLIKFYLGV